MWDSSFSVGTPPPATPPALDAEEGAVEWEAEDDAARVLGLLAPKARFRVVYFDMSDYAKSSVEHYMKAANCASKLRKADTPFAPPGSLPAADDEPSGGQLSGVASSIVMKVLWLARLARPDLMKATCDLAASVTKWSRNCDRKTHRLIGYIHQTQDWRLKGQVSTECDPSTLELGLYVDADLAGDPETSRSTSGAMLVLMCPKGTWVPLSWLSKRQTSTSRSTTEAEMVALATSLFSEALPMLSLWELVLGRSVTLRIFEDNTATITIARNGYSAKLRHVGRTHKINLGSVYDILHDPNVILEYVESAKQVADIFTKALEVFKWQPAIDMLRIGPPSAAAFSCKIALLTIDVGTIASGCL